MVPKLYMTSIIPPCRAVLMAAKYIGLDLDPIELYATEHSGSAKTTDKNYPLPTLIDDDGTIITGSHDILSYMVSKYAEDKSLYPDNDSNDRKTIDERLDFENDLLWPKILLMDEAEFKMQKKILKQHEKDLIDRFYANLEEYLENNEWVAGPKITIADFSLIPNVESANIVHPIDTIQYPALTAWLNKAQSLPGYDFNKQGLEKFTDKYKRFFQWSD